MRGLGCFLLLLCIVNDALGSGVDELIKQSLSHPEEFVNILGGTDSRYDISHGSTLPIIGYPWGFNHYTIQTDDDDNWPGWFFHPSDRRFYGLRITHQPSPWIQDYGNFLIKATIPSSLTPGADQFTGYSPKTSFFSPYYFNTTLYSYGTDEDQLTIEFVPEMHSGIFKANFPKYVEYKNGNEFIQTRRISVVVNGGSDFTEIGINEADGTVKISGYTSQNSGGVGDENAAFKHYFVCLLYGGEDGTKPLDSSMITNVHSDNQQVYVDLKPDVSITATITVRFATSFISESQAELNLQHEVATDKTWNSVYAKVKNTWNKLLKKVQIPEPGAFDSVDELKNAYTLFYSCLFRSSLFPRKLTEYDKSMQPVHWSPYATSSTNRVVGGTLSADIGFWDAHHAVFPLLTLLHKDTLGAEILQGWVNAYKEGGWMPKWSSPGYRSGMVGTMADVVFSDAIVNEIQGFDVKTAYEAIRQNAYTIPPEKIEGIGRVCLEGYLKYGVIPRHSPMTTGGDCTEIVSRSLNYMQSDWALSRAALKLNNQKDAYHLASRSMNYTKLFDQNLGLFRSVEPTGEFTVPFDQWEWGNDYTEGGPHQYRFYVPWDLKGLADLYSKIGKNMCNEIEKEQESISTFHVGVYVDEIHEQTELVDHCWGQYSHNNQPVHHMLWSLMYNGYRDQNCGKVGQKYIRRVLSTLYRADSDMFPGDEDNGEMASWYVLSALGLYNVNPGSGEYTLGSPLFNKVVVNLNDDEKNADGTYLTIIAKNNNKKNVYVRDIKWNNEHLDSIETRSSIDFSLLKKGGVLTFDMTN